ncbi:MAG: ATP-binding protein, partial [Lachnospiraceae bacterium]|nr:ATP-binding protein [Lachnospiraceae bacterium]
MDEMILRESTDPQIREYASNIKQAGSMLLSLVNDILDFSKIESGKMDIIPVDYDLGILLSDTIELIRSRAEEKKLQLELKIESDTPVHLHGDEVRLRQIITNILTNAVKYTPEGKVILTVSGKKVSAGAVQLYVSVKDTGIGIKEEDIGRLFDSFQRVDESRNRNIEGTGLGLSITMLLLNLMGSRLEVESTYGEGSDFYFYLEQKQLDDEVFGEDIQKYYENEKGKISISAEQFYAPDAKILVVDDNEMNLKVFLGLLKNHGMQIDTAMSGKECLARMEKNAYHIIFMDHLMPEMDGVETLRRIRELKTNRSKDAVIIILTANAVAGAREMFLQEGFADYLSKPIIAAKLEKMIQKYLPEELLLKNELGQKEEILVESGDSVKAAQSENCLVDWKEGRLFCMNDEEFYREMLQTFLDSPSAMELRRYYEESDFENYRIKIHAIKTNLANIGAMTASDMAKQLELALKNENNVSYVQENHEEFMKAYERVVSEVKTYMESANTL